jgi:D-beta-D-heptose 7-phosphate kinase/D-beta-D-heptose 1-phosphate adenosyltransferase
VKTVSPRCSSWDEAISLARQTRARGRRVVFTNGVFDLLHPGHVRYLAAARDLGDILIVGINSDRSVRANKGSGRPVNPVTERAEVLLGLKSVDAAVVFDEDTPRALIASLEPDVLVKGADWGPDGIVGREEVEGRGGQVVRLELARGFSTTGLIAAARRK